MSPFVFLQYCLPHHLLTRVVGKFAASKSPGLKNFLIRRFISHYKVDMSEAIKPSPEDYVSFNDFFTRALAPGARPVEGDDSVIVSPADGATSAIGDIRGDTMIQAKGVNFSLTALLGGDESRAAPFRNGQFATVYLSPKDYHRVHMPMGGKLTGMTYVPGRLFSVNQVTSEQIPGLFARNERAVCFFETDRGPMAVVLVGAMIVAAIDTIWARQVAPSKQGLYHISYNDIPVEIARGAEMGRFRLGSTAIAVFGPDMVRWNAELGSQSPVRMGQAIGRLTER